jgi:hypothetical protein
VYEPALGAPAPVPAARPHLPSRASLAAVHIGDPSEAPPRHRGRTIGVVAAVALAGVLLVTGVVRARHATPAAAPAAAAAMPGVPAPTPAPATPVAEAQSPNTDPQAAAPAPAAAAHHATPASKAAPHPKKKPAKHRPGHGK